MWSISIHWPKTPAQRFLQPEITITGDAAWKETSAFQAVSTHIKTLFYWPNFCLLEQQNPLLIWHQGKIKMNTEDEKCCLPALSPCWIRRNHPSPISAIPATALAAPLSPCSIPWVKGRAQGASCPPSQRCCPPFLHVHRLPGKEEPWLCVVFSPSVTWNTSAEPSKAAGMHSVRTWFILHTAWVAAQREFGHLHTLLRPSCSQTPAQPESLPGGLAAASPAVVVLQLCIVGQDTGAAPSQVGGWL